MNSLLNPSTLPAALITIYIAQTVLSFLHNLHLIRKTCPSLPRIAFPISEANLLYLLLFESRWFNYVRRYWLPTGVADYIADAAFRGRWDVKDRLARKHGGVYISVTPGLVSCHVGDADVVSQVVKDRKGFVKPVEHLKAFDMYGPSVFTSEGSQWAYHHRYTAAAFNDKNNSLVWKESITQAREMTACWEEKYKGKARSGQQFTVTDTREDILKLSLNIICGAGFGVSLPYKPAPQDESDNTKSLFKDATTPAAGYSYTFRGVMEYMNRSMTSVFVANGLLPRWIPRCLVPFFKNDFAAHENLKQYLHALVGDAEKSDHEMHNLLGRLVAARREDQAAMARDGRGPGLSDTEILGNTYIFSLAGHETTATTLRFALALLAIHQDVQDKLYAELREVLCDQPTGPAGWEYSAVFPRLVTPLCIMLETLRLYPPVGSIPKLTATHGADIMYKGERHHLPPNVRVNLNANALHYLEEYWGPHAGSFNPERWDKRNTHSFLAKNEDTEGLSGPGLESADIHKPVRGSFIPFSDGLRACIGRKFAQVEFIATLAVLCHEYRVTSARIGGESEDDASRRVENALRGSSTTLTLALGGKIPLAFAKRDSV
ncbi:cytochrome P450 [Aspergillus mulundensis]|uniref:Putative Cytochrome P450 n=1 Tax=Aspergillus mulundensis TaxID=1810919 RepID=A0A3D8S5J5_9EURO|nr:putative Cytochrome P450 [Aspergillus mulundensis]RDW81470.1 putative Cytochrome P450 [Aspergillus mulundensis]